MFLFEVKQQQLLAGIRSFLKIYSTITVAKLAQFMEVDEATLRFVYPYIMSISDYIPANRNYHSFPFES